MHSIEDIIQKLKSGECKIYEIENYLSKDDSIIARRKFIEEKLEVDLNSISGIVFNPEKVHSSNCENVIGALSMPLGVAGPLKIIGRFAKGSYMIPLATTEGALVASINRGAKILTEVGGAHTYTKNNGISRAPVFRTKSIKQSFEFCEFVSKNLDKLKSIAHSTSSHLEFLDLKTFVNGRSVWLRFSFNTSQAMGMNMAVKATQSICDYLTQNFDVKLIALSGNVCIDKKPAAINSILGRGREAHAEVVLTPKQVEKYLKCTVDEVVEVNSRKIFQGGAIAGSLGFNAHSANMVAALFVALGQDIAHVVDASTSITTMEKDGDNLYVSVRIPSLNVATIGGGTGLKPQSDLIRMILTDVESKNYNYEDSAAALSEIIAAVVLAGEISLGAAFASNTFAKAHEDLGRSKK